MRSILTISALALTVAGCGPKANDSTPNINAIATSDDVIVAENDGGGIGDNSAMPVSTEEFLAKAAMSDMYEVEAGNLAAAMGVSAGVKAFARSMVEAHTATTRALKAALAKDDMKMTPPTALDPQHQALIDALKAMKGDAFDTLYKSQQADAHADALSLMQSYAASGDKPALKAFAGDTVPKVQDHLDMLNKLT